jgi:hypothetical protein
MSFPFALQNRLNRLIVLDAALGELLPMLWRVYKAIPERIAREALGITLYHTYT